MAERDANYRNLQNKALTSTDEFRMGDELFLDSVPAIVGPVREP